MRQTTLIILAAVTLPLAAAAIFIPGPKLGVAPPAQGSAVFPTLKDWINTATSLSVIDSTGTVTLERKAPGAKPADGWTLPAKGGYPVPPGTIRPILDGLLQLREVEPKTERPKLCSRLDLADPGNGSSSHEIDLGDAKGAPIIKLIVGKHKEAAPGAGGTEGVYIRKPDDARTWLAEPSFTIPSDTLDWIDHKIVDIEADKIHQLVLVPANGKPLEFERAKPDANLEIKDLPKDFKLKSDNPGSEVASGFRYLDLADVKPAAEITGPTEASAHLVTFDGASITFKMVKQGDDSWVTITATGNGDGAKTASEITDRTHGWAYKLPEGRAKTLETKLSDLEASATPATPPAGAPGLPAAPPMGHSPFTGLKAPAH